ncbi:MAG: xanthine dehydrogenase, partial [Methylocystis sp.]
MPGFSAKEFLSDCSEHFVISLGTNEIASAVAARLTWERRRVVLSHDAYPPVIRRGMAFHDALYGDR